MTPVPDSHSFPKAGSVFPELQLGPNVLPVVVDCLRVVDPAVIFFVGAIFSYLFFGNSSQYFDEYKSVGFLAALIVPFTFIWAYRPALMRIPSMTILAVTASCCCLFALFLGISVLGRFPLPLTPGWVFCWFAGSAVSLTVLRFAVMRVIEHFERVGVITERVAIIGAGPLSDSLVTYLREKKIPGFRFVGVYDDRRTRVQSDVIQPSGCIDDLIELGKVKRIDKVLVTLPGTDDVCLLDMIQRLKALSVEILLCPDFQGAALPHRSYEQAYGLPMVRVARRPLTSWHLMIKGAMDLILGSLFLVILSPLMCVIALIIKLESPGPILFRQFRHGYNNCEIEVLKFRSMRHESRDLLAARQTSRGDDRITRVGAFLRKYSLDELPQFINVIRGEMSLVGPRPHAVGMRTANQLSHEIVQDYAHRHRVKPGITGWAQINGHRGGLETASDLQKRIEYDLYYIDHFSIFMDLKILILTPFRIFGDQKAF